jgi:anti-anti-sigma factor
LIFASGALDVATPPSLFRSARIARSAQRVTVDLSLVTFIDAAGLSAIVKLRNKVLARGQEFHLIGIKARHRRVFIMGGLGRIL